MREKELKRMNMPTFLKTYTNLEWFANYDEKQEKDKLELLYTYLEYTANQEEGEYFCKNIERFLMFNNHNHQDFVKHRLNYENKIYKNLIKSLIRNNNIKYYHYVGLNHHLRYGGHYYLSFAAVNFYKTSSIDDSMLLFTKIINKNNNASYDDIQYICTALRNAKKKGTDISSYRDIIVSSLIQCARTRYTEAHFYTDRINEVDELYPLTKEELESIGWGMMIKYTTRAKTFEDVKY